MSDTPQQVISKLQIIKEMAPEKSVQQLADVMIGYVLTNHKNTIGFDIKDTNGKESDDH